MSGFLDIHCHILPGLDDGPPDVSTATALVQRLQRVGFSELFPTPHQKSGSWSPTLAETAQATEELRAGLVESGAEVTIHAAAAENMWDDLFLARQDGGFPTYPGGHAFLLELPGDSVPAALTERLFGYRVAGKLPVLAHVERYLDLARDLRRIEAMGRGAALLVNLSSLGGMGGWRVRRLARKLVRNRVVHALASDAHHPDDVEHCEAGIRWVRSHLGEETLHLLLREFPRRIIAGDLPDW
jgi:protein-tyrosine phosphatase